MKKKIVSTILKTHAERMKKIFSDLDSFLLSIEDFHFDFMPEAKNRFTNIAGLRSQLKKACDTIADDQTAVIILYSMLSRGHIDIQFPLNAIEEHYSVVAEDKSNAKTIEAVQCLKTMLTALIISDHVDARLMSEEATHISNFRHMLSALSENTPEFLMIYPAVMMMLFKSDLFGIKESGRAVRAMINSFRAEDFYIHFSTDPNITNSDKKRFIPYFDAYEGIYRAISKTIMEQKYFKQRVYAKWISKSPEMKESFLRIKEKKQTPRMLIKDFLDHFLSGNELEMNQYLHYLVATVDFPKLIRELHMQMNSKGFIATLLSHVDSDDVVTELGKLLTDTQNRIYSNVYQVMQEYRTLVTKKIELTGILKSKMASISKGRRESDLVISKDASKNISTPILGKRENHTLLPETKINLKQSDMLGLYNLWPIPENSQRIFNSVCTLQGRIDDPDYAINHHLYREKTLEFLMRLNRLGIKVVKHQDAPLLTTAIKLQQLDLLENNGLIVGSTGHWRNVKQMPPTIIRFTQTKALGNCMNVLLRHLANRVFLGTGEFYESPFVLDATPRWGEEMDMDGEKTLDMKPGLFFVEIPQEIRDHWDLVQLEQKPLLDQLLQEKIQAENDANGKITKPKA
ncbi:MAG: hypothetical protein A2Y40_02825 [Candidatus Margulisbacteria bacterium GWF2_35_9]|nr:MAG: hypothetical protein A2Y40_02825 [Candidatus Margulisbacteria bacterium GWF2_35_9]